MHPAAECCSALGWDEFALTRAFRRLQISITSQTGHRMSFSIVFRMMYWSIRKDWRVLPHLMSVLVGWLTNLVWLWLRGLSGGGTVAIGLVEHLGDIVAAEPIARLARRLYPRARVIWFAREAFASVPAGFATVDAVVKVNCLTEWLLLRASGVGSPAWDLHINQRYCLLCQIPVLKSGPAGMIDSASYFDHGSLLAVECLSAGIPVLTDGPALPINLSASAAVDRQGLPACFIAIHCASNEASKDWPRENWSDLVRQLSLEPGIAIVEVGIRPILIEQNDATLRNLCGQLSIQQTAEVLRRATLFIGIDSGPAHLANAVGVPGIILLGLYKGFADYMPYSGGYENGENATIVRTNGPMNTLPVADVLAAVHQRLDWVHNHLSSAAYPHAERPGPLRPSNSPIVGKKSGA